MTVEEGAIQNASRAVATILDASKCHSISDDTQ
jgi:hypothetical protein